MIKANDILIRETTDGLTVWVSHRVIVTEYKISEEAVLKGLKRYKKSLPLSWQKKAEQSEFFLDHKPGKSWRWGRKGGQYYYDLDTIPNRKPSCYRDRLPSKDELVAMVDDNNLRGSRERQAEQRRMIAGQVMLLIDNTDIQYFKDYKVGDKCVLTPLKARQLAEAVAWIRFLKRTTALSEHKDYGFATKSDFLALCAELLESADLEGLRIKTPGSLRKTIAKAPDNFEALRSFLVSGKYCNDNARKLGKHKLIDYTTGEILEMDAHEAVIMTYWLNPGGSTKDTKRSLWEQYAADMEAMELEPLKQSTFNHYTNTWTNRMLSSKERHGKKHADEKYRPYVPAKPLEFANSLWASDGSGIVPYRYLDREGKPRMMKLYVMMVSDVASKYIAGFSVSKRGQHIENFSMMREAVSMALLDNGKTEVLDFISDNHSAYTSDESKIYLQQAFRNFRTIKPHKSQGNPAETMFRLFKRRFKSYFNMPETSWDAHGLESMANPDYFDIMTLPTYDEAITKLAVAINEWNSTELSNGLTPAGWFHTFKNESAGQYTDRQYRVLTGNVSKRDLSYSRGTLTLERGGIKFLFDVPTDADTIALIAKHMGYAPSFSALVYWNEDGADIYTEDRVYIFTCKPSPKAAKSMSESDSKSLSALSYHDKKGRDFDGMLDGFVDNVENATAVLSRNYDFNIQDEGTKEYYNGMRENVNDAEYRKGLAKRQIAEQKATERKKNKETKVMSDATLEYQKRQISDIEKYTK